MPDNFPVAAEALAVEGLPTPAMGLSAVNGRAGIVGRFQLGERFFRRGSVERFLGTDGTLSARYPAPVVLLREPISAVRPGWPSLAWEEQLRERCRHLGLPRLLDRVSGDGHDYLIAEAPAGRSLWDAWDDPSHGDPRRYEWLEQLAELMKSLHAAGVIFESLRPDQLRLTPTGQVILADTSFLLPLPLPPNAPVHPTLSSPPELLHGEPVDFRADLYSFGAMHYALLLGRELSDIDFHAPGLPRPVIERFPDVHPLLGRVLSKTFCRDMDRRFPTMAAEISDPTGFNQLSAALAQCKRVFGKVRIDLATWTTTGIVRGGNEDATSVHHAIVQRADETHEAVLAILADGMGGTAAGEVAAALAVESLRTSLTQQKPFSDPDYPHAVEAGAVADAIAAALHEANRFVGAAAKSGTGRPGMGCTAEVVYCDGQMLVVGHVGDSRVYRLHLGEFRQLTRDHTLVNRLVEEGVLTAEEAEVHPRRSELQQAIGCMPEILPDVLTVSLDAGDWVLICSDGLTNQIKPAVIQSTLERSPSAESAARRLVNLANLDGAIDNTTAVVLRAY